MRRFEPMTLANMRENGVRAVIASCANCGRSADVNVDILPETLTVPEAGKRLRCSSCGGKTISTRPAWHIGSHRPGTPDYRREGPPMS
jgi:DNA-directed RNA polymerase subunit RPC12/RpoP